MTTNERYVVLRFGKPKLMPVTDITVPGWETLGSVIFHDVHDAMKFLGTLDNGAVYRLDGPLAVMETTE